MTPKERVLKVYPDARIYRNYGPYGMVTVVRTDSHVELSGEMKTEELAWQSAADNLPKED